MNGDNKEEAQRPRPLSGGIWTLFSWLRRSERSSSSESISSVGSARTAVSFDFLSPGRCNYTNTPVVLNTQLGPPTETYKKRLQDRNQRRQRDRDITLHRKYGLYREYGNGYDGFSLPASKRVLASSVDRQNRDRRAASECLQRRAAYVPGKRRAPLPPGLITSASLPRSYKRKRPAPKPPIIKETIEEIQTNNSTRMSSNFRSDGILPPELELLMHSKTEKDNKKGTGSKDVKPKAEKSFLKHIFENKKRNSSIETTSIRLLPSISELDKQAAEIIENNKLRQNREYDSSEIAQSSKTSYEGNFWFCTSCLRKYNSSVTFCNNCYRDKNCVNTSVAKCSAENSSLKTSIETQTQNYETTDFSKNNTDERKMLKEILKEMKDSLPKKSRDRNSKINILETETPTLRIGSSVVEKYKGQTSQPLSSNEVRRYNITTERTEIPSSSRILSISSLLSERHRSLNAAIDSSTEHDVTNVVQHTVTLGGENHTNKSNVKSSSPKLLERNQGKTIVTCKDQTEQINKIGVCSQISTGNISLKTDKIELDEYRSESSDIQTKKSVAKEFENKNISILKSQQNSGNTKIERPPHSLANTNLNIESKNNEKPRDENMFTSLQILQDTRENRNQVITNTSKSSSISTEAIKFKPTTSKANVSNCNLVVTNVTAVTSNNNIPDASKASITIKEENKSAASSTFKMSAESSNELQTCKTAEKTQDLNYQKSQKPESIEVPIGDIKPVSNLHTPLKISTLLNPLYTPRLSVIKENQCTRADAKVHNEIQTSVCSNKNNNIENDENKKSITSTASALTKVSGDLVVRTQKTDAERIQKVKKMEMPKPNLECKVLPSASTSKNVNNTTKSEQYDRRSHLINQLEQSIARGDEIAAAEAAVQLAKLKLSCSVLSFSSQIIGESPVQGGRESEENKHKTSFTEKKLDGNITENSPLENKITQTTEVHTKLDNKVPKENVTNDCRKDNGLNNKPSTSNQAGMEDIAPIDVWVEDKQTVRGPIRLRISRRATMADLRRQAEHSLGLATHLQRWIVGKSLCNDDSTMVVSLAGPELRAPFYLCVVQPEPVDKETVENIKGVTKENEKNNDLENHSNAFYTELVKLEQQSLVKNVEPFECGVCMEECGAGAGVVLRECIHTFCRECLSDVVQHCQEPTVSCPATGCSGLLQEREIRSIVTPEEYERWLARSLATAECGTRNTFHCRTPDCTGWAFCDPGVRRFPCPVCKHTNCVQCQAIHEGETCEQHQVRLREAVTAAETYKDDEGTQALLNSLISRGEALECPECKAIITKKWGCDWVKCSACKTEICWVTKGRRWGPAGRGDTSGGCRCGVDGQRCHPSCGYCH